MMKTTKDERDEMKLGVEMMDETSLQLSVITVSQKYLNTLKTTVFMLKW